MQHDLFLGGVSRAHFMDDSSLAHHPYGRRANCGLMEGDTGALGTDDKRFRSAAYSAWSRWLYLSLVELLAKL